MTTLARNTPGKQAGSGRAGRRKNGREKGGKKAGKRRGRRNTVAPAGPAWCGSPARQTPRPVPPFRVATRPFSGCPEGSAGGALGVVPPAPQATAGAGDAAQQREAVRFIAAHCRAAAGRQARAGEGGRQGGRRGRAGTAGTAAAGTAARPGRQHEHGDGTRREANGRRRARGQVGGRGPGGTGSPTRLAGRRCDLVGGQGHIGGAGGPVWGNRFPYPIRLVPVQGVNALTPLDLRPPGGVGDASPALGQGPEWGMSPPAGRGGRRGEPGGNGSPTVAIRG